MKGALITLGIVVAVLVLAISMCVSANNSAVVAETGIKAQYSEMENVLSQYSLKVKEAIGVSDAAIDGLKEVMSSANTARYGADGSKATMQWIKESYPGQVDPQLYRQVQQIVEAGRNKFENEQTALIDKKQMYSNQLGTFPSGFVLRILGFPKIDLDKYSIISSGHAKEAFKTGVEDPIELKRAK